MTYSWVTLPTFADGAGNEPDAADLNALAGDLAFIHQELPIRALLWHMEAQILVGNDLAIETYVGQYFGHIYNQSPGGEGSSFFYEFILAAGTYTIDVLRRLDTNGGIVEWVLDGVTIDQQMTFYADPAANNSIGTIADVEIAAGQHVLTGTVNDKDPASSGYRAQITNIMIYQAGDIG